MPPPPLPRQPEVPHLSICVAGRAIGPGHPCYVIAEAGVNHNGDPDLARRLVEVAAEAGADAVKFQTFRAERLATPDAPKAAYQLDTTDPAESQLEMLRRLELLPEKHDDLVRACRSAGIEFLSTPFDEESADFLEKLGVPAFKTPSGEITNGPYLRHVARKGRPMLVSTGMSDLAEVAAAVHEIRAAGDPPLALLHCVSSYPAPAQDANLRAMATLASTFGVPVGWSDHTDGTDVALAAVALGARVLEKHFTLDRALPGPDHKASLEPDELGALITGVRRVESSLGHGRKEPAACEAPVAAVARKSLVLSRDVPAGGALSASDLVARRPGTGIAPLHLPAVAGRRARAALRAGTVLTWEMLE